jgi:hypothetical protein
MFLLPLPGDEQERGEPKSTKKSTNQPGNPPVFTAGRLPKTQHSAAGFLTQYCNSELFPYFQPLMQPLAHPENNKKRTKS